MIDLTALNAAVPQDVKDLVAAKRDAIKSGKLHPFQGPIRDQSGAVKVAEGQTMDDGALLGLKWYVEGVEGSLPQRWEHVTHDLARSTRHTHACARGG